MVRRRVDLSAYRSMWLLAMFDLPVDDAEHRREYTRFRTALLKNGFTMLQYSVYARFIPSEEAAQVHRRRIQRALPPDGEVRLLAVTDHQFGKMEVFCARKPRNPERAPGQLLLF
jgi:CRISPR-associated protein Cas2